MAYRRRYQNSYQRGREFAEQHIRDAERLSFELGGTDKDVKKWFFSLSATKLEAIFTAYGQAHGAIKEDYARSTYNSWKQGRRRMSGTVAERLFALLPPFMPVKDKFLLVESLWNHVGPRKKILIKAGTGAPIQKILDQVTTEVSKLTTNWIVPDGLTRRFNWLAQNDSTTYQQLMSHIKLREKKLGQDVLKDHIPQLKEKFAREISETTSRISYIIEVGNQMVELRLEGTGESVDVVSWYEAGAKTSESNYRWVFIVIAIIVAILFINS